MNKILTLICTCIIFHLSAEITPYLKDAPNKSEFNQIRNIDFIYMINLDERPEKFNHSKNALEAYGIIPYRFSAVNGWKLSPEDLNTLGITYKNWMKKGLMGTCYLPENNGEPQHEYIQEIGKNYFCHCMSRGAIGIALSHLSVLKDAYESGYETIWVLEDDIEVIKDPHILSDLIEHLDALVGNKNWDFLFTDQDTKNNNGDYVPCTGYAPRPDFSPTNPDKFYERIDISSEFRKIGARYGAYSMVVRRSGMKKMLDFLNAGVFLPYDMEYTMPNDIQMYNVREDIVSPQLKASSDNGAPN